MNGAVRGPVLIVDAAALFEVVSNTRTGLLIKDRLSAETDLAAPHVVDVEVLGVIRRDRILGLLDPSAAQQAVDGPVGLAG
jgi:hypothetical protein